MSARNAEPETVALGLLDACERAVRGMSPDYSDLQNRDAQFKSDCFQMFQSRLRQLKAEAAVTDWNPKFTRMLDRSHSIVIEKVNYDEKESVRTRKMKCMACGRWEHCCTRALSCIGHFESDRFNSDPTSALQDNWNNFIHDYTSMCTEKLVHDTRVGRLFEQDLGEYAIGTICLRKVQLYYVANTLLMDACYSAYQAYLHSKTDAPVDRKKWFYANTENARRFMVNLSKLESAVADQSNRRALPVWGVDETLWNSVRRARMKAAGGNKGERIALLRRRSEQLLRPNDLDTHSEDGTEQEDDYDDISESSEEESGEDGECGDAAQKKRRIVHRRSRCSVVLSDSDDDEMSEDACFATVQSTPAKPRRACAMRAVPVRCSQRSRGLSPAEPMPFARGPRNEGREDDAAEDDAAEDDAAEDDAGQMRSVASAVDAKLAKRLREREEYTTGIAGSRRPAPTAHSMAQENRMPGNRLPARRSALLNLGTLQLKLLHESRDDDAAICTAAMFTIQEMLSQTDQGANNP